MGTWLHFRILARIYKKIAILTILFLALSSTKQSVATGQSFLSMKPRVVDSTKLFFLAEPLFLCLGNQIKIAVNSSPFSRLTGMNLVFDYDTSRMQFLESENYLSAIPNFSPQVSEPMPGRIEISYEGAERSIFFPALVVELSFFTIKHGNTLLQWKPAECLLIHAEGAPFNLELEDITAAILPLPDIQIHGQTDYCEGEDVEVYVTSGHLISNLSWTLHFDTFNEGSLSLPNVLKEQEGFVRVNITDFYGCAADSIFNLAVYDCDFRPSVPSAFRPDSEILQNRLFKPIFGNFTPNFYSMQIFNNWGQLLFETRDYNFGWDGRFNGSPLNQGVYAWKIIFNISTPGRSNNDYTIIQGTVLIVR